MGNAPYVGRLGNVGYGHDVFHVVVWAFVIVGVALGIRWLISQGKRRDQIRRLRSVTSATRVGRSTKKSLKQRKRTLVRNE
jgi:hypothetical protein